MSDPIQKQHCVVEAIRELALGAPKRHCVAMAVYELVIDALQDRGVADQMMVGPYANGMRWIYKPSGLIGKEMSFSENNCSIRSEQTRKRIYYSYSDPDVVDKIVTEFLKH